MSEKKSTKSVELQEDFGFGDRLHIPKPLKEEMESKGLEWRWAAVKYISDMGGYHPMGWVPYKPDSKLNSLGDMNFGKNAEGYVIRGGSILTVRSKALGDKHRSDLEIKRQRSNAAGAQYKVKNNKVNSI